MKPEIALTVALLAAGPLFAADTNLTGQVSNAVAKLKTQPNYSWTTKLDLPGMPFTPGPIKGQTEKDGFTLFSQEFDGNTFEAAVKGVKVALKIENEWRLTSELDEMAAMMGQMLTRSGTAAEEAENLLGKTPQLVTGEGGLLSGDLTEQGAKELLTFGPRRPNAENAPPPPKNAKASVKFWLKDGALSKFELHTKGTIAFGPDQQESDFEMTRTVEIQDVGKTKFEVPAEARKKLEAK